LDALRDHFEDFIAYFIPKRVVEVPKPIDI